MERFVLVTFREFYSVRTMRDVFSGGKMLRQYHDSFDEYNDSIIQTVWVTARSPKHISNAVDCSLEVLRTLWAVIGQLQEVCPSRGSGRSVCPVDGSSEKSKRLQGMVHCILWTTEHVVNKYLAPSKCCLQASQVASAALGGYEAWTGSCFSCSKLTWMDMAQLTHWCQSQCLCRLFVSHSPALHPFVSTPPELVLSHDRLIWWLHLMPRDLDRWHQPNPCYRLISNTVARES